MLTISTSTHSPCENSNSSMVCQPNPTSPQNDVYTNTLMFIVYPLQVHYLTCKLCAPSLNKSLALWPNLSLQICNKLLPTRSYSYGTSKNSGPIISWQFMYHVWLCLIAPNTQYWMFFSQIKYDWQMNKQPWSWCGLQNPPSNAGPASPSWTNLTTFVRSFLMTRFSEPSLLFSNRAPSDS